VNVGSKSVINLLVLKIYNCFITLLDLWKNWADNTKVHIPVPIAPRTGMLLTPDTSAELLLQLVRKQRVTMS
jgi:hypothetical protein